MRQQTARVRIFARSRYHAARHSAKRRRPRATKGMSLRRDQEERAVCIDAGEFVLEGLFVRGLAGEDAGAVIAPPHPVLGGSMDAPVVNELAYAIAKAGRASLRFNWRGVGASSGTVSGDAAQADRDFEAAFAYLSETVSGKILGCGYSFGALAAARKLAAPERIDKLLLVAPPVEALDVALLDTFFGETLIVVGECDAYAPVAKLEEIAQGLPHGRLEIIPEADHFFVSGLAKLNRIVCDWLQGQPPDAIL